MPIQPLVLQQSTPQQAFPFQSAFNAASQGAGSMLQNQHTALANALTAAQVPYAPEMAQAALQQAQAQPGLTTSETALNLASLPYVPYKYITPYIGQLSGLVGLQNANMAQLENIVNSPMGAQIARDHPEIIQQLINNMRYQASGAGGNVGNLVGGINLGGIPQPPGGFPGLQNNAPTNAQGNLNVPLPGQRQPLPMSGQQVNRLQTLFPGGVPQDVQNAQNSLGMQQLKQNTDEQARQKNIYATNIEKTLQQINPGDLTQYAGIPGNAERMMQQYVLSPRGKESTAYDNYVKATQATSFLDNQVRQFYGASIQPAMLYRLNQLSNPQGWLNNPKLATQQFNETKTILQNEMQTYRDAMKSPSVYQNAPTMQAQTPAAAAISSALTQTGQAANQGNVRIMMPNGKAYTVPQSQLQTAISRGGRVVNG